MLGSHWRLTEFVLYQDNSIKCHYSYLVCFYCLISIWFDSNSFFFLLSLKQKNFLCAAADHSLSLINITDTDLISRNGDYWKYNACTIRAHISASTERQLCTARQFELTVKQEHFLAPCTRHDRKMNKTDDVANKMIKCKAVSRNLDADKLASMSSNYLKTDIIYDLSNQSVLVFLRPFIQIVQLCKTKNENQKSSSAI